MGSVAILAQALLVQQLQRHRGRGAQGCLARCMVDRTPTITLKCTYRGETEKVKLALKSPFKRFAYKWCREKGIDRSKVTFFGKCFDGSRPEIDEKDALAEIGLDLWDEILVCDHFGVIGEADSDAAAEARASSAGSSSSSNRPEPPPAAAEARASSAGSSRSNRPEAPRPPPPEPGLIWREGGQVTFVAPVPSQPPVVASSTVPKRRLLPPPFAKLAVPAAIIEVSYTTGAYGSAPLPPLPPPMSAVQKRALSSPPRHKKALCSPPRGPRRRCNDDHESAEEDLHSPIEPPWRRCKDDHEGAEEDEQ